MFSHMMVGSNDLEKSKKFYDATFKAMGGREGSVDPKGRVFYHHNGASFLVTKPIDGQPATHGNGSTIGFKCDSPEQVKQFHDVAVANGGTSCEEAPGLREGSLGPMHLAYVRDPSGNKLCAIHRPG